MAQIEVLCNLVEDGKVVSSFAKSLVNQHNKGKEFSPKQKYWVDKLVADWEKTEQVATQVATQVTAQVAVGPMRVYVKGELVEFNSSYSHDVCIERLRSYVDTNKLTNSFARSLVSQVRNGKTLSNDQMTWAHKLLHDHEAIEEANARRKAEAAAQAQVAQDEARRQAQVAQDEARAAARDGVYVKEMVANMFKNIVVTSENERKQELVKTIPSFEVLVGMLNKAALKLQKPKIVFKVGFVDLQFDRRSETQVSVSSFGSFNGMIINDVFVLGYGANITPEIVTVMTDIASDPIAFAKKYGMGTGHCCFCTRPLCEEHSIAAGYGPSCARNYGMPWGGKLKLPVKRVLAETEYHSK